jgi:hypothetical protein
LKTEVIIWRGVFAGIIVNTSDIQWAMFHGESKLLTCPFLSFQMKNGDNVLSSSMLNSEQEARHTEQDRDT